MYDISCVEEFIFLEKKMEILYMEPMRKHTTFRTGGNAKRLCLVKSEEEINTIVEECTLNNEKYIIIGNGSNLLVSDKGYDGTIIKFSDDMAEIRVEGENVYVGAGALLSKIAATARDNSLKGFEFASGIPGSLGGAIYMNAGAYGGEMKDVVVYVDVLKDGHKVRVAGEDMEFSYRHSLAEKENLIIIGAMLKLESGDKEEIIENMKELAAKRLSKQPLEYPSAGSTFKRPEGYFAGKLIMDAGLAGYTVGGARVSEKHCGFVINYDNATSQDIYRLMAEVTEKVKAEFGVLLEPEVQLVGEF